MSVCVLFIALFAALWIPEAHAVSSGTNTKLAGSEVLEQQADATHKEIEKKKSYIDDAGNSLQAKEFKKLNMVTGIQQATEKATVAVRNACYTVFKAGLVISIVAAAARLLFQGANFQAFCMEMVKVVFWGGLALGIINHTDTITSLVLNFADYFLWDDYSFSDQGVLFAMLDRLDTINFTFGQKLNWSITGNWGLSLTLFFVLGAITVCFAVMFINYLFLITKLYLVLNLGIIAVAVGGAAVSNRYAMNYLKQVVGYAIELMVFAVFLSVIFYYVNMMTKGTNAMQDLLSTAQDAIYLVLPLAVFAVLSTIVPRSISALVEAPHEHAGVGVIAGAMAAGNALNRQGGQLWNWTVRPSYNLVSRATSLTQQIYRNYQNNRSRRDEEDVK